MADWRNRIDQITNKVKHQLCARGVVNLSQLKDVFLVCIILSQAANIIRHPHPCKITSLLSVSISKPTLKFEIV